MQQPYVSAGLLDTLVDCVLGLHRALPKALVVQDAPWSPDPLFWERQAVAWARQAAHIVQHTCYDARDEDATE